MMPVAEREKKTARIDLRLTPRQRALFEAAASARDETLNHWAAAHLEEAAKIDIASQRTTYLSDAEFDALLRDLENGTPPEQIQALLQQDYVWEK